MAGHCISQLVLFKTLSTVHLKSAPGFSFGWFQVPWKVPKLLTKHGIPRLDQCCPHCRILISLVPAWNGIVLMDSRDNVILFSLPWLGIIHNKSWLLKSHVAQARCVKFLTVRQWGIQLVVHSMTQEISMFAQSFWTKLILMFCTLFQFSQSATSSGNSLSAMSISCGRLMNWISCSWFELKTYITGYANTWELEMSRINLTIDSHLYHDSQASHASLNHSIRRTASSGWAKISGAWSEHGEWILLQILTPRMMGNLQRKQPLMKWSCKQYRHYVNSLYLLANKITLSCPSQY
jgi:hypothetical protein